MTCSSVPVLTTEAQPVRFPTEPGQLSLRPPPRQCGVPLTEVGRDGHPLVRARGPHLCRHYPMARVPMVPSVGGSTREPPGVARRRKGRAGLQEPVVAARPRRLGESVVWTRCSSPKVATWLPATRDANTGFNSSLPTPASRRSTPVASAVPSWGRVAASGTFTTTGTPPSRARHCHLG